jgi:hypothetical protein
MAKPASGTALDTGGALYSGLANWWGMLEGSGSTTADGKGSNTGTLDASVTWTTDGDGPLLAFSDHTVNQPVAITNAAPSALGVNNWSIAWRGKQTVDGTFGMVCGDYNSPSGHNNYLWMRGSNYLRYEGFAAATVTAANFTNDTSFTTSKDYVVTGVYTVGVNAVVHLYVDGVEDAASPIDPGTGIVGFDTLIAIGNGFANLGLEGQLSYFGIWINRALTQTDAASLHSDPYGTMYGSAGIDLTPTAVTSSWSVPTQAVSLSVVASAAVANWTIPTQTLAGTGAATVAPSSVVNTWVVPTQRFQGHGQAVAGSRSRSRARNIDQWGSG